jgi:hypothetical protein
MDIRTRKAHRTNRRAFTRKRVQKAYGTLSGYSIATSGYDPKFGLTYGEVTPEGVEVLADTFRKHKDILTFPTDQRTFYDLGSGIGRSVVMMASLVPNLISKGIELVTDRHEKAVVALSNLKDKEVKKRIQFTCGSFLDANLQDAAWIFISNLCFSEEVRNELMDKLCKELRSGTVVASSKEFPFPEGQFEILEKCIVPMTWSSTHELHLARKI